MNVAARDLATWRRLALAPIDAALSGAALPAALDAVRALDVDAFAAFLRWHKLDALWGFLVEQRGCAACDPRLAAVLARGRRDGAALALAQGRPLADALAALDAANIACLVFKGAMTRAALYPDPGLRPATDLDLLVAPHARIRAVAALREAGFAPQGEASPHEATFARDGVDLDLHWDVLRPGRLRGAVAQDMLERRRRLAGLWAPSREDVVFLMLVHPAFAKHVNSPHAALVAVVDYQRQLADDAPDWDCLARRLEAAGARGAAWSVARFYAACAPAAPAPPHDFLARLAPGAIRRRCLSRAFDAEAPTRLLDAPFALRAGLTLALHDSPADALRAARTRWSVSR